MREHFTHGIPALPYNGGEPLPSLHDRLAGGRLAQLLLSSCSSIRTVGNPLGAKFPPCIPAKGRRLPLNCSFLSLRDRVDERPLERNNLIARSD
jgi:hypothetical protein